MTRQVLWATVLLTAWAGHAAADTGIKQVNLTPTHDTYATHNDQVIHGSEPVVKVGIEPQECFQAGWDPCDDDDKVCCEVDWTYNYCAPEGQCEATEPVWSSHRKFRGYIRFDLSDLPEGKILAAGLRLQEMGKIEEMGPPVNVLVTELKKIGIPDAICEWDEDVLNDTNGTTWNSLPQNLSISDEGAWNYDVTKAVADWVEGNVDVPGTPIQPNCGFYLYDPDYGNSEQPIQRWVLFSSKEGGFPPQLSITVGQDLDGDGWFGDCDEEDPTIHPEAIETCDGVDQDCDGLIDEEDCDGEDNDCDGEIDEGEEMCGEGTMCLAGQCLVTCVDECAGPYDKKCMKNDDGIWEEWHCLDKDEDPCFEYYLWEECKPDYNCNLGSCSSNCLDLCEPEQVGASFCHQDSLGKWYLAGCDDYDEDGCLEPGDLDFCGPAAFCFEGECWPDCEEKCDLLAQGDCLDECVPGSAECRKEPDGKFHLFQCKQEGEECWAWADQGACTGVDKPFCYPTTNDVSSEDDYCTAQVDCYDNYYWCSDSYLGVELCIKDKVGRWFVAVCDDADGDGCPEWAELAQCDPGGGCVDAVCTPGCDARCNDPLTTECTGEFLVSGCVDVNQDGCHEWVELDECNPATQICEEGACKQTVPPCQDECEFGTSKCEIDEDDDAYAFDCLADEDPDPCFEWGNPTPCGWGCDDEVPGCADEPLPEPQPEPMPEPMPEAVPEPMPEPAPDVVTQPDPDAEEVVEPLYVTDSLPAPDVGQADALSTDMAEACDDCDESNGCSCRLAPHRGALPRGALLLLFLSLCMVAALRFRLFRKGLPLLLILVSGFAAPALAEEPAGLDFKAALNGAAKYLPANVQMVTIADAGKAYGQAADFGFLTGHGVPPETWEKMTRKQFDFIKARTGITFNRVDAVMLFVDGAERFGVLLLGDIALGPGSRVKTTDIGGVTVHTHNDDPVFSMLPLTDVGLAVFFNRGQAGEYGTEVLKEGKNLSGERLAKFSAALPESADAWVTFVMMLDHPKIVAEWERDIPFPRFDQISGWLGEERGAVAGVGPAEATEGLLAKLEEGRKKAREAAAEWEKDPDNESLLGGFLAITLKVLLEPVLEAVQPKVSADRTQVTWNVSVPSVWSLWVVGTGSAVAVPAFIKYLRKRNTKDARRELDKLHAGAARALCTVRINPETGSQLPFELPPPQPATPPLGTCCKADPKKGECQPNPEWWNNETWARLMFMANEPHSYSYEFKWEKQPGNIVQFEASAYGDLDCDGVYSTFSKFGFFEVRDGQCTQSSEPTFFIQNEME